MTAGRRLRRPACPLRPGHVPVAVVRSVAAAGCRAMTAGGACPPPQADAYKRARLARKPRRLDARRDLMSQTLELTQDLIARRSLTPADEGCQALMARAPRAPPASRIETAALRQRREPLGAPRRAAARCSASPGTRTWCRPGPLEEWTSDPFAPAIRDGRALRARGGGHEEWPGGHGHGRRGLRPRAPAAPRLDRLPDHERRGRSLGRWHQARGGNPAAARPAHRLVRGG